MRRAPLPDDRRLFAESGLHVGIHAASTYMFCSRADKPPGVGAFPLQHAAPGLEPFQIPATSPPQNAGSGSTTARAARGTVHRAWLRQREKPSSAVCRGGNTRRSCRSRADRLLFDVVMRAVASTDRIGPPRAYHAGETRREPLVFSVPASRGHRVGSDPAGDSAVNARRRTVRRGPRRSC